MPETVMIIVGSSDYMPRCQRRKHCGPVYTPRFDQDTDRTDLNSNRLISYTLGASNYRARDRVNRQRATLCTREKTQNSHEDTPDKVGGTANRRGEMTYKRRKSLNKVGEVPYRRGGAPNTRGELPDKA